VMLAREGLSLAALKRMEDEQEASAEDVLEDLPVEEHDDVEAMEEDTRPVLTQGRSRR